MLKWNSIRRIFNKPNFACLLLLSFSLAGFKPNADKNKDAEFRPHMQSLYLSLVKVLGFVVKNSDDLSSKDSATIEKQLKNLKEEAKTVRLLAKFSDKGHEFLAKELEKSTALAYSQFKAGHNDSAKFFVSNIVNTCFACHTSRTSPSDSQFSLNLAQDIDVNEFDSLAKARFLSLSRQFEASATEYEKILLSLSTQNGKLDRNNPMIEYLVLTLRVKEDSSRALKTFSEMAQKPFPEVVRKDLKAWVEALTALANDKRSGTELEQALRLLTEARSIMDFPRDRSTLVQYIRASKLLNEYIKRENLPVDKKAEAYFELGTCEVVLASPIFPDKASIYFEETVKLAPKSALARKAFAQYEENLLYGYSGSSGLQLPDDEKLKLEALRTLAFD